MTLVSVRTDQQPSADLSLRKNLAPDIGISDRQLRRYEAIARTYCKPFREQTGERSPLTADQQDFLRRLHQLVKAKGRKAAIQSIREEFTRE